MLPLPTDGSKVSRDIKIVSDLGDSIKEHTCLAMVTTLGAAVNKFKRQANFEEEVEYEHGADKTAKKSGVWLFVCCCVVVYVGG